ncbi:hypothetical protein SAMN05443575_0030 [Jatrophihabitans endophyticus]|uniref:VOC domain-containing protein n=1 Tax=Jatrophihabitans endophyticus TaxID=1206085 RepID=A0A1M5BXF9_9ACTN|nr:VOC family protein [Jatrophihabitans endophyticus]SHF47273.1 hypothetical protein SAMN05443575_0030 [Jatrophihabitans endophyticus]
MTSRIAVLAIDAVDPEPVARFWCAVLGWQERDHDEVGIAIGPADATAPGIDVLRVPEAKTIKNRLHLDLRADGGTTAEELDRLLGLGARRVDVGQDDDATWVVLADPGGNEFCLLSRTVAEAAAG